jgi:hypothetical protein
MGLSRLIDPSFIPLHQHRHTPGPSGIDRRGFLRNAAGVAAGAVAGSSLLSPLGAQAVVTSAEPNPIPGGTDIPPLGLFHFFFPGKGNEPSSITDFRGFVGIAQVGGIGVGTDTPEDPDVGLVFDVDLRFMKGTFVGKDGKRHRGTFGFV